MRIPLVPGEQNAFQAVHFAAFQCILPTKAPAECACAALRNKDGGHDWQSVISFFRRLIYRNEKQTRIN
jgi:hypothetical protein